MNEWVKRYTSDMRLSTQNSGGSAHSRRQMNTYMPYFTQLHIMSIRWAYYEQMKQQNIWSVHISD